MDPYQGRYTPSTTPPFLRGLLFLFGLGGILSGLFYKTAPFSMGLSYYGILEGKFWQLATYPFILGSQLSWWSLFFLAIELFFFWIYSAAVLEQKGSKSFFVLIAGSTLAAGLASLAMHSAIPLTGIVPIFFGVVLAWMGLNRGASLLILGLSVRASTLILGFIGLDLLIHLSQNNWVPLAANAGGALFGLAYSKFPSLIPRRAKSATKAKIYDIHSGKPISEDEQFMDAMLARVSLHGESSLTREERERMAKISAKNLRKKP